MAIDLVSIRNILATAFMESEGEILAFIKGRLLKGFSPVRIDDLAGDIYQETAAKLLDLDGPWIGRFDPSRPALAWIKHHAGLEALSVFRDRRRSAERLEAGLGSEFNLADLHESADRELELTEVAAAVGRLRSRVSESEFDLLWRVFVDGVPQSVIAEQEGVPVGTIYSKVHRLRAALRKELSDLY